MSLPSISSYVHTVAEKSPDRIAIVAGHTEITYLQLSNTVHCISRALRANTSIKTSTVAVIAHKNINTVELLLGAIDASVTVVPINPLLKFAQVVHILQDSKASTLVCTQYVLSSIIANTCLPTTVLSIIVMDDNHQHTDSVVSNQNITIEDNHLPTYQKRNGNMTVLSWYEFVKTGKETKQLDSVNAEHNWPAVLLYTSGSTGRPKGVIFTQNNLYYGAASITKYLENSDQDKILALMPFSFDYGLSQLTSAIFAGATLVLFDYFVPKGVIDAVVKYKITGIPAVPHVWNQLATLRWPEVTHLRYITSTGGRLNEATISNLKQALPTVSLYSMYGFTEAFRATYLHPSELNNRPTSIGQSVPHAQVKIVDPRGKELPPGEIGELIQSGALVSAGYLGDATATNLKFKAREVSTKSSPTIYAWSGDLAYRDNDGFLYFVSRRDDQIKINGYRLTPSEIEIAINKCNLVQDICIVCDRVNESEYNTIAFVSLYKGAELKTLENWCRKALPGYMVPKEYIVLESLPLTPNNKIDKQMLISAYKNRNS